MLIRDVSQVRALFWWRWKDSLTGWVVHHFPWSCLWLDGG